MDELIDHFKKRAKYYDKMGLWVNNSSVMSSFMELIYDSDIERIIDIGAGTGVVLKKLLSLYRTVKECVALDISKEMLSKISDAKIKRVECDAHEIPLSSDYFSLVIARQSLHYMKDIHKVLREIYRVLIIGDAFVIGQITPFNEEDEEYWKTIIRTRQPLRRNYLTLDEIISLLKQHSFRIVATHQMRGKESLNSWLNRYKTNKDEIEKIRALHLDAPSFYKEIHNFQQIDEDILFDNCWTFIRAIKN